MFTKEILQEKLKYNLKDFLFNDTQGTKLLDALISLLEKSEVDLDYQRRLLNAYIMIDVLEHAGVAVINKDLVLFKNNLDILNDFERRYFCYYLQYFQKEGALA